MFPIKISQLSGQDDACPSTVALQKQLMIASRLHDLAVPQILWLGDMCFCVFFLSLIYMYTYIYIRIYTHICVCVSRVYIIVHLFFSSPPLYVTHPRLIGFTGWRDTSWWISVDCYNRKDLRSLCRRQLITGVLVWKNGLQTIYQWIDILS